VPISKALVLAATAAGMCSKYGRNVARSAFKMLLVVRF